MFHYYPLSLSLKIRSPFLLKNNDTQNDMIDMFPGYVLNPSYG